MDWEEKILNDNRNAAFLASELSSVPGVILNENDVETNIVRFEIEQSLLRKLKLNHFKVRDSLNEEKNLLMTTNPFGTNLRLVTHRDLSRTDCEYAVSAIREILRA